MLKRRLLSTAPAATEHLVVVGSGWAGYEFIRLLSKRKHPYSVTVLSPRNYFLFTPLLASSSVGTLEFRSVIEPIRGVSGVRFIEAAVRDIDFDKRCIYTARESEAAISYDTLVLACGAAVNTFDIPGVSTHALFLKDIDDARRIRHRIIDCFDRATTERLPHLVNFAVIGGGPTGVEFSAELHDLITEDLCRYYPKEVAEWATITIYDVSPRILSTYDAKLSDYCQEKFRRDGIVVKPGCRVEWVNADEIGIEGREPIKVGMTVWAAGVAPTSLVRTLRCDKNRTGVVVNDTLQVLRDGKALPKVYAIGDCACINDGPLPCTAQVAKQEGQYLSAVIDKADPKPFRWHNFGSMAYIGDWRAIVDLRPSEGRRINRGGRLAWLLWRSAYFSMAVSWRNKLLILVYWVASWLFGRDISKI